MQYVIVTEPDPPSDKLPKCYGPFGSEADALDWATEMFLGPWARRKESYCVAEIKTPSPR
jgi:hypothetical protein